MLKCAVPAHWDLPGPAVVLMVQPAKRSACNALHDEGHLVDALPCKLCGMQAERDGQLPFSVLLSTPCS